MRMFSLSGYPRFQFDSLKTVFIDIAEQKRIKFSTRCISENLASWKFTLLAVKMDKLMIIKLLFVIEHAYMNFCL